MSHQLRRALPPDATTAALTLPLPPQYFSEHSGHRRDHIRAATAVLLAPEPAADTAARLRPGSRLDAVAYESRVAASSRSLSVTEGITKDKGRDGLPWHVVEMRDLWHVLQSQEEGLSRHEASKRLEQYGPNALPHQPPPTWWQILLRQFQSPLIYILVVAAVVAVIAGDYKDAGFIAAVLAVNAVIGGYQEWRAERSSRALQQLLHLRASVLRDGEVRDVDAEDVVPGDIVYLESGNRVPADLRLIASHGLEIDESLLTGESLAVHKDASWSGPAQTPPADRLNLGYAASIVIRGRGKGVVVATGSATMVGQLASDVLAASGGKPPLMARMERFGHTVAYAVLAAVAVVSLMGIAIHGYNFTEMFLFGVALAVSAIPEGLPAALTVTLAVATTRMAQRGVIVRRLAAVEGLGSCTMIASDKTGTLTCNELTVRVLYLADGTELTVSGQGFVPTGEILRGGSVVDASWDETLRRFLRAAVLCNEADLHRRDGQWNWRGDPTDLALLSLGRKGGVKRETLLDEYPLVNEIPFEPEHQFAATFHRAGDGVLALVKGGPERVLSMCAPRGTAGGGGPFEAARRGAGPPGVARVGPRRRPRAPGPAPGSRAP